MRTLPLVLVALVGVALGAALGWSLRGEEGSSSPLAAIAGDDGPAALDSVQAVLQRTRARFERLHPPNSDEENGLRRPRTPRYRVHLDRAEEIGPIRVTSSYQIDSLLAADALVPLADTEHYVVRTLEHSAPLVTPSLKRLLDRIGERFAEGLDEAGLPPYRFVISSLLRTPSLQEDLRDTNRNAATAASSHEYGVSADLVIWRYVHAPDAELALALPRGTDHAEAYRALLDEAFASYGYRYWDHLFGLMTRILSDFQRRGDALVLLEEAQPVFHITVARRF